MKILPFFASVIASIAAILPLRAELIPAARMTQWTPGTVVGIPGGIPTNRTNVINVTQAPYNADNTGNSNAATAIQAAINAAPAGSVVYLPAGTYRLDSTLNIGQNNDGITLRGAGTEQTILRTTAQTGLMVGVASDYSWAYPSSNNVVTGTRTKGTDTLTIGNTDAFKVGQIVQIKVSDQLSEAAIQAGAVPVVHVSSWRDSRRMKSRVVSKTATTVTIFPPLYFDCSDLTTTINGAQYQTDNVGVEDFSMECLNGTAVIGIEFEQCYASWIKNVKVNRAANYAFFFYDSLNCEIRHSYANQRYGEGSNGAGILSNSSSACLFEDNILYKFFPLIEVNQGSTGNVIAYNLFEDSRVFGGIGSAINTNHGPHNSYNLYEGNIGSNVQADGYFGSASEDTIFRNWLHGTILDRSAASAIVSLNRFTRNYSLVGNVLGTTQTGGVSYSFGNPNMGNSNYSGSTQSSPGVFWADWNAMKNAAQGQGPGSPGFQELDLGVQATTLLKANHNIKNGGIASGESLGSDALPDSLYLPGKPSWFGNLAWPPINPLAPNPAFSTTAATLAEGYKTIPAGYRFVMGDDPGMPPVITSQPASAVVPLNGSQTFTVATSTSSGVTYRWKLNGSLLADGVTNGVTYSGTSSTTLTVSNASMAVDAAQFTVVATNSNGSVTSSAATLTIGRAGQTISFGSIASKAFGSAPFTVSATSTSGLPVTLTSLNTSVATVNGNTITIVGIGSATIRASQAGNSSYYAASNVDQTLTVTKAAQTINFSAISNRAFGTAPFGLTVSATSGLTVSLNSSNPSVATVSGTTVTIMGAGTTQITASQAGNANYFAANNVVQNFTVDKASQALTFPALADKTLGDAAFLANASTSASGLNVTLESLTPSVAVVNNGVITLVGAGSASIRASQAGNSNYLAATSITRNFTVAPNSSSFAPTIGVPPQPQTTRAGDNAYFVVLAGGLPVPSYQWQVSSNGTSWNNLSNNANYSGVTASALAITNTPRDFNSLLYRVIATNSQGSATSSAASLTVTVEQPSMTQNPSDQATTTSGMATFTANASGAPRPLFQWQTLVGGQWRNVTNNGTFFGADTATLTITRPDISLNGTQYRVTAGNGVGSPTYSGVASLTVNPTNYAGTYFGTLSGGGSWALYVRSDNTATYIATLPNQGSAFVTDLTVGPSGTFQVDGVTAAMHGDVVIAGDVVPVEAAPSLVTLSGSIFGGAVNGTLGGLGVSMSGGLDSGAGPAAAYAGYYKASALVAVNGATYSIVGASGQTLAITMTSDVVDAATGSVSANGTISTTTQSGAQFDLAIDASSKKLGVKYRTAGQSSTITFSGLNDTVTIRSSLANLSIRSLAGSGDNTLIAGFVMTGSTTKSLLVRGVGPTLSKLDVSGVLNDPTLKIYSGSNVVTENDNWSTSANAAEISATSDRVGAFSLPTGSADAVALVAVQPGVYTAHVNAKGTASGVALLEVYDTALNNPSQLVNISARSQVGTGEGVLIVGFVIDGNSPKKVMVRAIGPTLKSQGVSGALADPTLALYQGSNKLHENDNWGGTPELQAAFPKTGAFNLPDNNSKDSALLVTLEPGAYTAIASGVNNTTGVALLEIYLVP